MFVYIIWEKASLMLDVVDVNVGADCWEEERGNVRGFIS